MIPYFVIVFRCFFRNGFIAVIASCNGDIGVVIGGDYKSVMFYLGKNVFWTDDALLNSAFSFNSFEGQNDKNRIHSLSKRRSQQDAT